MDSLVIPSHFCGPPDSANGGYTCGRVAGFVGDGPAEVTLRSPPPLETPMQVERDDGGVRVSHGDLLVAEGRPAELELEPPRAVGVEEAAAASRAGEERWCPVHPFPTCVVCGPRREPRDGYRIFPGELRDGVFAAVWTPDRAAPEETWAALDCPTSAPIANFAEGPAMMLGRLTARIDRPVEPGRPHVVLSWPIEVDGRKRHAAAALFSEAGELLAVSRALWIELRAVGSSRLGRRRTDPV